MKVIVKSIVVLLALYWLQSIAIGSATAGTFTMKQCDGARHQDFQGGYGRVNGSTNYEAVFGCTPAGVGRIGINQDRQSGDISPGGGGQFAWASTPATRVIGTEITAKLKDANGIKAELIGSDGSNLTNLEMGAIHDGAERRHKWSNSAKPQTLIVARLVCGTIVKCANRPDSSRAFIEVSDLELKVEDTQAPVISASGDLWNWGGGTSYRRGEARARVDASDQGSGVASVWAEVNGSQVTMNAPICPGDRGGYSTRFSPCPLAHSAERGFDTTAVPFRAGANQIRFCARDYSGGVGCSESRVVLIDNDPSAAPIGLKVVEGNGWRPSNGFNLRWENPPGQVAPVIGAGYLLVDIETDQYVDSRYFPGDSIQRIGPVDVPGPGSYRAIVFLFDGAINVGELSETILRFDDRPPGDVKPEDPSGWVSADELPLQQVVEEAEPGGPSGISGYALSVSKEGLSQPCLSAICLAGELTIGGGADTRKGSVGNLVEGDHWVSAVAVSGALRSSEQPGSTMVKVDKTPPETAVSGIEDRWVNHPVTMTVHASDRLSGMNPSPGDDGEPKTVIAAEHHSPYESPGPVATFTIATEGVNRVKYWAEDLAGNADDGQIGPNGQEHARPAHAVVRIDLTPPTVEFDTERDPGDPEVIRITAFDGDSGVARASLGIRPVGTGQEFKRLETNGSEGSFQARVPSDNLAAGSYELRAVVSDRAGNQALEDRSANGGPMVLRLPLKQAVDLRAELSKGRKSVKARYGSRGFVSGHLSSGGGALSGEPIEVVEMFARGSKRRQIRRTRRTDGDGWFRIRLSKGPSRQVAVSFKGNKTHSPSSSSILKVRVKGKTRLKIKPGRIANGGTVRMVGSIGQQGALRPARGKLVAIQYLDPARAKWRPVEVVKADRRGSFRYRYRFRTISSAQRIIFRAIALPEAGWPYLPSTSKRRSVIVYPKDKPGS